ncbi:MAG: toll/interleukin-1 receptor domain-containing protein [Candidatus Levybacteria bacterium]|nr:toll/interleukin-1 receptor domain-containing protein [Candidatus Levybacteria bacterium]
MDLSLSTLKKAIIVSEPIKIKVFISYSTKDSVLAGRVKDYFEKCIGFEVFLAHDDLKASNDWPKEILNNLQNTDFVIPLLSKHFLKSFFANQELGIAFYKNLKIIPFSLDGTNSDSFIRNIQAYKSKTWTDNEIVRAVTIVFLLTLVDPGYIKYQKQALDSLVNSLLKSDSKRTTAFIFNIFVQTKDKFILKKYQIELVKKACKENAFVYNAAIPFPKLKKFLLDNYNVFV